MRWWVRRGKEETKRPQFAPKKELVPRLWWCAYHQVARGRDRQVQEAVAIGRSMVLDIGGVGHSVQGKTWFCWFVRTNGGLLPISSGLYSMWIHGGTSSRFAGIASIFSIAGIFQRTAIFFFQVIPFSDKIPKLCSILLCHRDNHELSYHMSLFKCMRKRFACFLQSESICPLLLFRRGLLIRSCFRRDLMSRIVNVSSCAEAGRVVRNAE